MRRRGFRILIVSLIAALIVFLLLSTMLIIIVGRLLNAQSDPNITTGATEKTIEIISNVHQLYERSVIDNFSMAQVWIGTEKRSIVPGAMTLHSTGDVAEAYRSFDAPIALSSYLDLSLDIDDASHITWLTLYLMTDTSCTSYFECNLLPLLTDDNSPTVINKMDFQIGEGSPSWNDISAIKLAFQAKDDNDALVTLSEIGTYGASSKCSIWFDDGWKTTYTQAYAIMEEKDMNGILSVIRSHVGYPNYCDENALDELYASGWDLVNHTESHADLCTLTLDDAQQQIAECQNYLVSRGYTRAADNFVPPYCATDESVDDLIRDYAATSRTRWDTFNRMPIADPYHLGFMEVKSTTPTEDVFAWIDTAISNDLWLILVFHSIDTPADAATTYPLDGFQDIINYLHEKRLDIDTATLSQILDGGAVMDVATKGVSLETTQFSTGQQGTLLWEDDFSASSLNANAWNIVRADPFKNNELQTYRADNIALDNGCLNIISEQDGGGQYYSGAVTTQNKAEFLYGKIEICAQLPSGRGIFPAFWMLPPSEAELPEIDIVEYLGHQPNRIWHVLHYVEDGVQGSYYANVDDDRYDQDFHVYHIEWTPDRIAWFIDGIETFSVTDNVPSQPMYLYLNTAIGGNWPGDPDDSTAFPQLLKIDYVKYYTL